MEFDSSYQFPQQGLLFPKLSPLSSDVFSDKNDENMKSKKFKADNVPNFNIKINNEMEVEDYKSKNNNDTVNKRKSNGNNEMEVEYKISINDQDNSNNSNIVASANNSTVNNGKSNGNNGMEVENKVNVNEDSDNIVVNNVYNTSRDPNYSFEMTIMPRSDKVAQLLKRADNAMNQKKSIDKSKFDLDIKGIHFDSFVY
jgi:hypothetical protein